MARPTWGTFFDIEEKLLNAGPEFGFFQAIRLIRLMLRRMEKNGVKDAASVEGPYIRVRPELSLGFPAADIARITEAPFGDHGKRFQIEATFLGIYGISSPLPSFYTEDLLYEASEDNSVTRDFLDIISTASYQLFIRALLKYNLFLQVVEEHDPAYLEYICLLAGLDENTARGLCPEELILLRYGGILNLAPRSALGLKTILKDALGTDINLEQCIPCMVPIPHDQRTRLGSANSVLGESTHLGSEIEDSTQMFRIVIGPVPSKKAAEFLPGGISYKRASFLASRYIDTPIDYEFLILIDAEGMKPLTPGKPNTALLGVNTWFAPPAGISTVKAVFSGNSCGGDTRGRPRRNFRC